MSKLSDYWPLTHKPSPCTVAHIRQWWERYQEQFSDQSVYAFAIMCVASQLWDKHFVLLEDAKDIRSILLKQKLIQPAMSHICKALSYRFEEHTAWVHDPMESIVKSETKLGEGTFSDVYEAILTTQSNRNPRKIACKVIQCVDGYDYRQFFREALILQRLQGILHIPTLYTLAYESQGDPCLCITLGGKTLQKVIKESHYNHVIIYDYMIQIFQCLHDAHSRRVLHKDLKPNNIVLNGTDNDIMIIDWGSADIDETDPYSLGTTRWYRAPELWKKPIQRFTSAADIWSAGCIFGELVTQKPLFSNVEDEKMEYDKWLTILPEKLDYLEHQTRVKANLIRPLVSKEQMLVLRSMLALDPLTRPSALELMVVFETLKEDLQC